MKNLKFSTSLLLISLAVILFACNQQPVTPVDKNASPTTTLTVAPSPTSLPSYTPTSLPSSTPTVIPLAIQTKIEVVTDNAVTGDGGNSWGGHQTRIVQTKDGIFTAYTVAGKDDLNREWRLAERKSDGSWTIITQGESGREPVNLLAGPDGTLYIVGWPKGRATMWNGKPQDGTLVMNSSNIPNELNGNWPYNSAGINANGDLCVLSSDGGEQPGGLFFMACYLASRGQWVTQTSRLDFRFCYTYVFPGSEGQLSLVSTRDVRWEAMGYKKPEGTFDYVFNALGFWRTDDFQKTQLKRVYFLEERPTDDYPIASLNAQQDAYLDSQGQMHIIYVVQGESTLGTWASRHAIISPSGELLYDEKLPDEVGGFSRIFQDQKGLFYLLSSSGLLYSMGLDGKNIGTPIVLDLGGYQVEYSGYGISVPRAGTPLSDKMNVVFPSSDGSKWIYFQLDFPD